MTLSINMHVNLIFIFLVLHEIFSFFDSLSIRIGPTGDCERVGVIKFIVARRSCFNLYFP
jgi:hypothetical protein